MTHSEYKKRTCHKVRNFKGRKPYTLEYKDEVVAMVITGGMTEKEVAQREGVHQSNVNRWVKNALKDDVSEDIDLLEVGPEDVKAFICMLIDTLLEPKALGEELCKEIKKEVKPFKVADATRITKKPSKGKR